LRHINCGNLEGALRITELFFDIMDDDWFRSFNMGKPIKRLKVSVICMTCARKE
jgi:hypothetical protein